MDPGAWRAPGAGHVAAASGRSRGGGPRASIETWPSVDQCCERVLRFARSGSGPFRHCRLPRRWGGKHREHSIVTRSPVVRRLRLGRSTLLQAPELHTQGVRWVLHRIRDASRGNRSSSPRAFGSSSSKSRLAGWELNAFRGSFLHAWRRGPQPHLRLSRDAAQRCCFQLGLTHGAADGPGAAPAATELSAPPGGGVRAGGAALPAPLAALRGGGGGAAPAAQQLGPRPRPCSL